MGCLYKKERGEQSSVKERESLTCFRWFVNRVLFMVEVLFLLSLLLSCLRDALPPITGKGTSDTPPLHTDDSG